MTVPLTSTGVWLPECAYRPHYEWRSPLDKDESTEPVERLGIEEVLHDAGIRYFIVDSHLLKGGKPIGVYVERFEALQRLWGQFSESYQVWSGEHGYPGDGLYLDFHKKHHPGGHRYWRVTDCKADLGDKQIYEPDPIEGLIESHADHFVAMVHSILAEDEVVEAGRGIVCAPFDAERFGHWWFEGPRWVEKVLRGIHRSADVQAVQCSQYLDDHPPHGLVQLPEGSWGEGGFHWIWLNEWTEWTWKHIYECEDRFLGMLGRLDGDGDATLTELLRQAGRELLLLESSDWQFLISTWHARDYAEERLAVHYDDFKRLADIAEAYAASRVLSGEDRNYLANVQKRDPVFPDLDLAAWKL